SRIASAIAATDACEASLDAASASAMLVTDSASEKSRPIPDDSRAIVRDEIAAASRRFSIEAPAAARSRARARPTARNAAGTHSAQRTATETTAANIPKDLREPAAPGAHP